MSDPSEDPLLKSSKREMFVSATIWLTALCWSVGYCAKYGYDLMDLEPEDLKFVLGFPDWLFYGVVLPWWLCTLISGVFAFGFMQDADLGETDDAPPAPEGDDAAA